jgi:hypothetical protein
VLASEPARFNRIKPFGNAGTRLLSAVGTCHDASLGRIQGVILALRRTNVPQIMPKVEEWSTGEIGSPCQQGFLVGF